VPPCRSFCHQSTCRRRRRRCAGRCARGQEATSHRWPSWGHHGVRADPLVLPRRSIVTGERHGGRNREHRRPPAPPLF
jgi:hypothetical protein